MAGYKSSTGRRSTRIKLLIYEELVQEPNGLTTQQIFERIKSSSVGRYVASPSALAQTIRITKGVESHQSVYINRGDGDTYMASVWVMADPQAFLDWYGDKE